MSDMERTEAATPKRRAEAREKGQLPKSQELNTAVLLAGSALVLNTAGTGLSREVMEIFASGLGGLASGPLDAASMTGQVQELGWKVLGATALFIGAMAGLSLAVAGFQSRMNIAGKALEPKWEKLDPIAGTKRLFSLDHVVEVLKSLLKLAVLGWAVRATLTDAWPEAVALMQQPSPFALVDVVRRYSVRLLMTAGGAYLALGMLDYWYQIWSHEKRLRMTKEDVKQEHKQSEGNPMVKQRMRSNARARLRRQMFSAVPLADVIVTNPTHIAVALKYEQGKDVAPVVVAMGQEKIAEKIRKLAREAGVPIVENKPVARALFASAEVGSTIPHDLYLAVIEIYAFIIRQKQAGRQGGRS